VAHTTTRSTSGFASRLRGRLDGWRDGLRTQMWPMPTLGIVVALALGVGLPRLDGRIDQDLSSATTAYLFGGGPSAARTLLGTIASSLITVTALTFSLTVVTLQLASSQFSPRLLRTFTSDRFVHATLALLLGTFTYSLAVLRTVRDQTSSRAAFVPQVSVTLSFVLAVLSVLALVLFLAHLARQIRVETMLRNVQGDARDATLRLLSERPSGVWTELQLTPPADALTLVAPGSGFLLQIDERSLLEAAVAADAVLAVSRYPGNSLIAGTPLGAAWPRGAAIGVEAEAELRRCVDSALTLGFERTSTQDIAYGLRQLTDVTSKALSPGINDPTTAVHALSHSSALLCELARYDLGPRPLHDDDDVLRVLLASPGFTDLLEVAVTQPRRYGGTDPFVLARLFALLGEVAWVADHPTQREAIAEQLERLRRTVTAQDFDATELARLSTLAATVDEALAGRWTPQSRAI
jgi:uncharacterized membrane protein